MGRRSYAMRYYRRRSYSGDNTGFYVLLFLAGFCTWGIAWLGLIALACSERPRRRHPKRISHTARSIRIEHDPSDWTTTEEYRQSWPPTLT